MTPRNTQPLCSDTLAAAVTTSARAHTWNRWRDRYNPLRGLNLARCVTLLEQYQRGEMADPQWAYFFIEQSDPDLFAILERREAALLQLDWEIKLKDGRRPAAQIDNPGGEPPPLLDRTLAEEQAAALHETYQGIDNLYEAIAHLQLATFRGFAHCEKYRTPDGDIFHLELVDQWNLVRDSLRGHWKYNPEALSTTFESLPDNNLLNPADFLIRERDRPVNRIALLKFIRASLSEKDWDAFIEIYGIPSGVVIGPAGIQPDQESAYRSAAQTIAEGGSGYLPHGSNYKSNAMPNGGAAPFRPRLDYLTEKLVLAGTGGLLTMLSQSGTGTLAGTAHQEAFDTIARAEARKISELLQRQLDTEVLQRHFPDQPALSYFELTAHEPLDPGTVADHAQKFAAAGYRIDVQQLEETSGYRLTDEWARENEEHAVAIANLNSARQPFDPIAALLFNDEQRRGSSESRGIFDESKHPRAPKGTPKGANLLLSEMAPRLAASPPAAAAAPCSPPFYPNTAAQGSGRPSTLATRQQHLRCRQCIRSATQNWETAICSLRELAIPSRQIGLSIRTGTGTKQM